MTAAAAMPASRSRRPPALPLALSLALSATASASLLACAPALAPLQGPPAEGGDPGSFLAEVQDKARRAGAEPDAGTRQRLVAGALLAGQSCDARFPGTAACDYALALALGLQARESPATAADGLRLMLERLDRAAAAEPDLDRAGPERVAALVLVRAPGWPLGPGDPEVGLSRAWNAAARFPLYPPNQLALAEALIATGSAEEGRALARRALDAARSSGEPDAAAWALEAEKLIAR